MMLKVFTIYDCKAEAYNQPFFMSTKAQAIRAFQDEVNNPQSLISKHPGDYTLFEIGEYDDSTATLTCHDAKINLGVALEMKQTLN